MVKRTNRKKKRDFKLTDSQVLKITQPQPIDLFKCVRNDGVSEQLGRSGGNTRGAHRSTLAKTRWRIQGRRGISILFSTSIRI